jgi:Prolyl oligopeptidase family
MAFDGPGQQAALFRQGKPFRHDWEAVLTPVVDAMAARSDVDADRIALIGVSQAGYWVPRALAFEHRFVAAVADPGVVDVSSSWIGQLPGFMRSQLTDPSKKNAFDTEMGWTERLSKSTRATLHFRGEPTASRATRASPSTRR